MQRPRIDPEISGRSDIQLYKENEEIAKEEVKNDDVQRMPEAVNSQNSQSDKSGVVSNRNFGILSFTNTVSSVTYLSSA